MIRRSFLSFIFPASLFGLRNSFSVKPTSSYRDYLKPVSDDTYGPVAAYDIMMNGIPIKTCPAMGANASFLLQCPLADLYAKGHALTDILPSVAPNHVRVESKIVPLARIASTGSMCYAYFVIDVSIDSFADIDVDQLLQAHHMKIMGSRTTPVAWPDGESRPKIIKFDNKWIDGETS